MNTYISNKFIWFILAIFIIGLYYFFPFSIDDSYIVGRYAYNFSEYNALAYNIEDPISALTSPLHAIFEGILYKLFHGDPVVLWKYTSITFLLIATYTLGKLVHTINQKVFLYSAILLTAPILLWTVAGLETTMLLFLLALFVYLFIQKNIQDKNVLVKLSILSGLIFLTRFDSAVFLLPLVLYIIWINRNHFSKILFFILIPSTLILIWFIFSYHYYGHIMPTSFFSKHPSFSIKHVSTSIRGLFWVGVIPLWLYFISSKEKLLKNKPYYILVFSILLFIGYTFTMAASHMMMSIRPLVPYLPIIFLLLILMKKDISKSLIILFIFFQLIQLVAMYEYGINFILSEMIEYRYIPDEIRRYMPLEQAYISMPKYIEMISILKKQGKVIELDWEKRNIHRKPVIFSLIEGATSYGAINSYFVGPLVTLGECKMPDYIMTMHAVGSWNLTGSHYKDNPFYSTKFNYEIPTYIRSNNLRNFTIARYSDLSKNDKSVIKNRIDSCNSDKKW